MSSTFVLIKREFSLTSSPTTTSAQLAGSTPTLTVSFTDKSANDTLLETPTGAYTAMRTFDFRGIMGFSGHVTRIASSLSQLRFATGSHTTTDEKEPPQEEDHHVVRALAQFRNADTLKPLMANLVQEGLRDYYGQVAEESLLGDAKVTVLCS